MLDDYIILPPGERREGARVCCRLDREHEPPGYQGVLENYLISSFWICIFFVQYVICVFYLCLCLIESMSPRPSNHLSSALTPDILDTTLQAEKRDHQDEHHKYIGRTTNNILGNALEKHNKYIRRV